MLGPMSEPRGGGGTQRHILKVTRQQTVAPSHSRPAAGCSLEAVGNSWEVWEGWQAEQQARPGPLPSQTCVIRPGTAANPCSSARQ